MTWPLIAAIVLLLIVIGIGAFLLRKAKWPSFNTNDGRKFWAFIVILGGCFIFTIFAGIGVYLVSHNVVYTFYLALAAHVQLFVGMGTFGYVLGRRMKGSAGKDGFSWDDSSGEPETPAEGAKLAEDAVAGVVEDLKNQERR